MAIGDELAALAAHHHRQLRMRLQLDEAEHHLRAGAFQVARPADIGLLVEAGLQLDERGDRLARFRRFRQRRHDGRVRRGAVERLLDRHHVRIARGLAQELHHRIEGFVRVVDDDVLLADRREAVAAVLADALGEAWIVRLELEIRPLQPHELRQVPQAHHALDDEDLVPGHFQLLGHEEAQVLRHRRLDLETDHAAAAALLERRLEQAHQILGLFLHLEIGIADHAERALSLHFVTGKQAARVEHDHLLQRDEARGSRFREIRQADEALGPRRQADERIQNLAVAPANQLQGDGGAEIGNERERMRRVDGERRQHREDVAEEVILEPGPFGLRQAGSLGEDDALFEQDIPQFAPAPLLVGGEVRDGDRDLRQLLLGRQPILRRGGDARAHLADEARDADHEELVEIVRRDRQESQLLQKRMVAVRSLLEHPPVELQPGQLAVDVALREAAAAPRRRARCPAAPSARAPRCRSPALSRQSRCAHRSPPHPSSASVLLWAS